MFQICNNSKWSIDIVHSSVWFKICSVWSATEKTAYKTVLCLPKEPNILTDSKLCALWFLKLMPMQKWVESHYKNKFKSKNYEKRREYIFAVIQSVYYCIQNNGWLINFFVVFINICWPHIKIFDMNLMWFMLLTRSPRFSCVQIFSYLPKYTPHINTSDCPDIVIA